ncbi:MAG TPA: ROK family protein [Aldersonia sp.]
MNDHHRPHPDLGLGIDVGGSTIKGGVVDLRSGRLAGPRRTVATPKPATPGAVVGAIADIASGFAWQGPIGVAVPAVVTTGVTRSAANVDRSWIEADVASLCRNRLREGRVVVINDADAAGIAEHRYGLPRPGLVVVLTFGTGIGSAILHDGVLVPNSELGHLLLDDARAEHLAAAAVKNRDGLDYPGWAARVTRVLRHIEDLFWPSTFVLGGEISTHADRWIPHLNVRTPVAVTRLLNTAGLVGAARAADMAFGTRREALTDPTP